MSNALARCTVRACPWRWRHGDDRPCPEHESEGRTLATAAAELGVDLTRTTWPPTS